jgi:hypothetical protein
LESTVLGVEQLSDVKVKNIRSSMEVKMTTVPKVKIINAELLFRKMTQPCVKMKLVQQGTKDLSE